MISFHDIAKGSDCMVKFTSVSTGLRVEFPAFITNFSDTYSVGWSGEQVYGRMDPIQVYEGTTRSISLAFDVVSPSLEMAKENMAKFHLLTQMMYPVYSEPLVGRLGKGRTLKAPPLMRLEFMNLIKNSSQFSPETGLLGCISGLSFEPDQASGFFSQGNELLSKNFALSFNFDPQHEGELGFEKSEFLSDNFPYGRPQISNPVSNAVPTSNPDVASVRKDIITGGGDD
jgi:hypothetical protein